MYDNLSYFAELLVQLTSLPVPFGQGNNPPMGFSLILYYLASWLLTSC